MKGAWVVTRLSQRSPHLKVPFASLSAHPFCSVSSSRSPSVLDAYSPVSQFFSEESTCVDPCSSDYSENRLVTADNVAVLSGLDQKVKDRILQVRDQSGFIPNVFLALARRPAEFHAFNAYYEAVMAPENSVSELTTSEREMIVVSTSSKNGCLYCVIAHGAMLRVWAKKDGVIARLLDADEGVSESTVGVTSEQSSQLRSQLSDDVSTDFEKSRLLTDKQKAMLRYCIKLSRTPEEITELDQIQLRDDWGWSTEAVWDMNSVVSLFALSNRFAHGSGLLPNPEFYNLARQPSSKKP